MLYAKRATTIDEQIALLTERGMGGDSALMHRWLVTVGYYRLSAYWLPFERPPGPSQTRTKEFVPNTSFETVVDIYAFDRKLRLLVTEAIERVEIALRSRWTNRISLAYGSHAHLDFGAFETGYVHLNLLSALASRAKSSSEVFVEHYRDKYDAPFIPPLWIVTELMTFGELSKWFSITKDQRIQSAIAHDLGLPTREALEGTLQLLSYIRNICAHHGRLWNRRTVKRLPNIKRFREDLVLDDLPDRVQRQADNRVYNPLVTMIHMLRRQSPDTTFATRLADLIETRPIVQQRAMGFPDDWRSRPCWR